MKISTSVLSVVNDNLEEIFLKLDKTSTNYIHLDVIDGVFAPDKTDFLKYKETLLKVSKPLDVHLMVNDVETYIENYKVLNPNIITFHLEVTNEVDKHIKKVKTFSKVGISIKPSTSVEELAPYLDKIDVVLVMCAEPGRGGQSFMDMTDKLKELNKLRNANHYHYQIEVDCGINRETIKKVELADIVAVGSYITGAIDYEEQIRNLIN